ncbi:hypothetical protein AX768_28295 [Burkholderia sp. PAMC 28687]|jgi:hypothetical protein|uniref:Glyoxalase n=1 Tax=Caballeronia sordidicola TaxID=196367 RepID=A0A242MNA1_CABSO|nr:MULTISPECIES: hypothetical protein [Burkholderiaceae]AME25926.1 hypothetical protein AXG89_18515 [Burkholderia sp. PAMC 26561]AMM18023.1 hypothetical protein AX768_28295 [Burkholderia sp. PAMC 28687]OTP72681.1 hypothetical protein PAMC26577_20475 [Caballeronia sordidicola]
MKRFHIALAVGSLDASIADYSHRLGQAPTAVVPGAYAMWRTDLLNFSINETSDPAKVGLLRHIGFEDDSAAGFAKTRDINGIEWEQFSPEEQDRRIVETYGSAIRPASGLGGGRGGALG